MPKVSIITPVYNGERFIERYFDMVLKFTHKDLELIIVNDASTDNTNEIIEQNRQRLVENGIELKYVKLENNEGPAGALNHGLLEVTGEYLSWHDVDDIYYPECISKSLEICLKNPEIKTVFSKFAIVNEENLDKILAEKPKRGFKHKNMLWDYIWEKNIILTPMRFVETKALFSVLKDRSIYISRGGQNWQLLMPITYVYKWGYVDEVLSKYMIRKNSHSHVVDYGRHFKMHEDILLNTIERMDIPKTKKLFYQNAVRFKYLIKRINKLFRISINFKTRTLFIIILGHSFSRRFQ